MSILIKGMEMPTSCDDCPLAGDFKCNLMPSIPALCKEYDIAVQNGKCLNNCPLVEIPPHGRLIDADVLMENEETISFKDEWHMTVTEAFVSVKNIADAPTIIEAEEGET